MILKCYVCQLHVDTLMSPGVPLSLNKYIPCVFSRHSGSDFHELSKWKTYLNVNIQSGVSYFSSLCRSVISPSNSVLENVTIFQISKSGLVIRATPFYYSRLRLLSCEYSNRVYWFQFFLYSSHGMLNLQIWITSLNITHLNVILQKNNTLNGKRL